MGWKQAWFGSDDPSRRQVARTALALAVIGLVLLGTFVDFVPAPVLWGRHMLVMLLCLGVIETVLLGFYSVRAGTHHAVMRGGFLKFLFVLLFMPVLLGGVSWLVFAKALPWAATRAFGAEYRAQAIMETHYTRSRRACDYRLRGGPIERSFPGYLCISEAAYRRRPEQDVPVLLVGRSSPFGIAIQDVYARSAP